LLGRVAGAEIGLLGLLGHCRGGGAGPVTLPLGVDPGGDRRHSGT
jgi:hypothetical protein